MNNTPTPRTNAFAKSIDQSNFEDSWKDDFEEFAWVTADFARQLETELAAAREELDKWEQIAHDKLSEICRQIEKTRVATEQRDEAREENAKLREIAESAINYLDQSYRDGFSDEVSELRYELAAVKGGSDES